MKAFQSIDNILDFAIGNEVDSFIFYTDLANTMKNKNLREMFLGFAQEEKKHKGKLLQAKKDKILLSAQDKITDMSISDYQVDVSPTPDMSYQEALILAMKREKQSFRFYTHLADISTDASAQSLFLALAQEEAKHKLKIELEYDEHVLKDN